MHVLVRGIPGSGKSWLCAEFAKRDIECIDTDDWLRSGKSRKALATHLKDVAFAVVVGVTTEVSRAAEVFFIEIPDKQLPQTYKRFVLREFGKIIDAGQQLLAEIAELKPRDIHGYLGDPAELGLAMCPTIPLGRYIQEYRDAREYETSNGAVVLPQEKILERVAELKRAAPKAAPKSKAKAAAKSGMGARSKAKSRPKS